MKMTSQEIMDLLGLKPHPTCGFVTMTFHSDLQIPRQSLPAVFGSDRSLGSVLYFLVTPEAQIRLHRIRSDQMYHHYLGDPLEVLLLYPDGSGEVRMVGPDLVAGMRPQLFIPANTFHVSRLPVGGSYALLGTSEWVGVEPADLELGDPDALMADYPNLREEIGAFSRIRDVQHLTAH